MLLITKTSNLGHILLGSSSTSHTNWWLGTVAIFLIFFSDIIEEQLESRVLWNFVEDVRKSVYSTKTLLQLSLHVANLQIHRISFLRRKFPFRMNFVYRARVSVFVGVCIFEDVSVYVFVNPFVSYEFYMMWWCPWILIFVYQPPLYIVVIVIVVVCVCVFACVWLLWHIAVAIKMLLYYFNGNYYKHNRV